jgi:class 3 adenylate cyclase
MARILLREEGVIFHTPAPRTKPERNPLSLCIASGLAGITFSLLRAVLWAQSPEPGESVFATLIGMLPEVAATCPLVFAAAWSSAALPCARWRALLFAGFMLQIPLTHRAADVFGLQFSLPLMAWSIGLAGLFPEAPWAFRALRASRPWQACSAWLKLRKQTHQTRQPRVAGAAEAAVVATVSKPLTKPQEPAQSVSPDPAKSRDSALNPLKTPTEPAPQRAFCTVIHCELANHATLVNSMNPGEFTSLLNKVINAFEEMVSARGGICDRLSSDALRAFFKTPPTETEQGQNALHCALSLKNRFSVISQACELKSGIELDMRIGVNTGEMVIAQFGSGSRTFCGVAGEAAEWGGRLASANLLYGSRVLIGASSHLLAGEAFEARPIDLLQRELPPEPPEEVFELLATKGALSMDALERLNRYREGVALFRERRWQEAASALRAARPPRSSDDAIDLLLHRISEQETLAEFPI